MICWGLVNMHNKINDCELERILSLIIDRFGIQTSEKGLLDFELNKDKSSFPPLLETGFPNTRIDLVKDGFPFDEYMVYGICNVVPSNDNFTILYENCIIRRNLKLALKDMLKGYLEGLYHPKNVVVIGFNNHSEDNGLILDCFEYVETMRLNPLTKVDIQRVHDIYFIEELKDSSTLEVNGLDKISYKRDYENDSKKEFLDKRDKETRFDCLAQNKDSLEHFPTDLKIDVCIGYKKASIKEFLEGI